jgi:hypothetical protein
MQNVVIIGASNVTLALPLIWKSMSRRDEPTRLFVAAGHGRSFGLPNTVMGRTLPSLLECGLWQSLDQQRPASGTLQVIITDVGNDILYGASVDEIVDWVTECVDRFTALGGNIVLTSLPRESLVSLKPSRFRFFRTVLFPRSRLSFGDCMDQARELDQKLVELATDRSVSLVGTEPHWYGADPIHVRRRFRPEAWQRYLSPFFSEPDVTAATTHDSLRVWRQKAEVRWRGRRRLESSQPVLDEEQSQLWLF